MSAESTRIDAERLKAIRATGKELKVPLEIVEALVTLGYTTEECDEYFAHYQVHGYVRLSNNAGFGDPKQAAKGGDQD